jgi:Tol biopolymer transport system component
VHCIPLVLLASGAAGIAIASRATGSTKPNGRIVFQANVGDLQQLFTIKPDGTGLKQITHAFPVHSGDLTGAEAPAWAPDGSKIAFDSDYESSDDNFINVFTVKPDGSGLTQIPLSVGAYRGEPSLSRKGDRLAVSADSADNQPSLHGIFVAGADGSHPTQVTSAVPAGKDAYDAKPSWSPDGNWIAFQRVRKKNSAAIFIVRVDGTGLRRLTPWTLDAAQPRWSPNGTRILFNSYEDIQPGTAGNLFTIRPNGTHRIKLTHFTADARPWYQTGHGGAWSPDGKQIVWARFKAPADGGQGTVALMVMDSTGRHVRQLTHLPATTYPDNPDWGTAP